MKRFFSLVLAIVSFLAGCGGSSGSQPADSFTPKVFNGTAVDPGQMPAVVQVLLKYQLEGYEHVYYGFCTGTVISSDRVLTAAHCLDGKEILEVQIGTVTGVYGMMDYWIHPDHQINIVGHAIHDAAVIQTDGPMSIPPIAILASRPFQSRDEFTIYGFGLTERGEVGTLHAGFMRAGGVLEDYFNALFLTQSNTCFGDSGGPAIYSEYDRAGNVVRAGIIGITSAGSKEDCSIGDFSYFTNVQDPDVLDFIGDVAPEALIG